MWKYLFSLSHVPRIFKLVLDVLIVYETLIQRKMYKLQKIYKWATTRQNQQSKCAPSEDSDQPGHPPSLIRMPRLIRVFAVRTKKHWVLSFPLSAQRRPWSDWADAQADLSLLWAHTHFVGFVMSRLKCCKKMYKCTFFSQFIHFRRYCWRKMYKVLTFFVGLPGNFDETCIKYKALYINRLEIWY